MARKSKNNNEEVVDMTPEMENGNETTFNEEMVGNDQVGTDVPGTDETAGAAGTDGAVTPGEEKDARKWTDNAGNEVSKSAFIREKFSVDNMSRKEISEKFEIPYRTVYGATVNMENAAEPTSKGRGVTFSKINVTVDGHVVTVKDDVVFVDGVALEEGADKPETTEVDRNTWIKEQVTAGKNRGDIAKALDLSYGVIYGLTKEEEGTRQKYEVEIENEAGEKAMISRSEYIRRKVAEGISKSDIAKELGVEYSVVWQATKKMKTVEEKFIDSIKNLEKFMDLVNNPEILAETIALLGTVTIKEEKKEQVTDDSDKQE